MASISGATNNLGNTTLRGFGGMVSGIDRDSIIEQMSLASTTKIQNQKNAITSLTWKQEAYRGVIDQILELQENYLSYAAKNNITDPGLFSKNVITAKGDEKITKYITATGSSDLLDIMSVRGVESLATSASIQSGTKATGAIEANGFDQTYYTSTLMGTGLNFGYYGTQDQFFATGSFSFPSSYQDSNNKTVEIDYTTTDKEKLAGQLNEAVKAEQFTVMEGVSIQFKYNKAEDALTLQYVKASGGTGKGTEFKIDASEDAVKNATELANKNGIVIRSNSSALGALGFDKTAAKEEGEKNNKGYTLDTFNANVSDFSKKSVTEYADMSSYLSGKKFTITYGGQSRTVELISKSDAEEIKKKKEEETSAEAEKLFLEKMQNNLNKAFGTGKIEVTSTDKKISFTDSSGNGNTLTISSSDSAVMKQIGLDKLNSNKVSLEGSLWDNRDRLGISGFEFGTDKTYQDEEAAKAAFNKNLEKFSINGVTIKGLNADTSVSQMISKINSSGAGVKATYLSTSNKLSLISTETGSGRDIQVGNSAYDGNGGWLNSPDADVASQIFGGAGGTGRDGQDAVMWVDYGAGGTPEKVVSSTNTFELDGLKVTASGTFGVSKKDDGTVEFDNTQAVTFDASADIDGVTEKVKKFLEDYNALVKAVNTHITTKPDKSYGPLSDAQKDEMNETSIENWEKKAKEGLLFNDPIMRDLSVDMQGMLNSLLGSGVSYSDLEEMGITVSEDLYDGGTLVFDETKFKAAMKNDPEKVGNVFTGGGNVKEGFATTVNNTLKKYATRYRYLNNGSYGRLVEEAGSEKLTLSLQSNTIYKQLKDMQDTLTSLQTRLKSEQDRYIKQFTYMEQAINNMNTQSSYLSSLTG